MYTMDRQQMRHYFFQTWQKFQSQQILTDLEQQIVQVILDHAEYRPIFNQPDKYLDKDYLPEFGESNPYLHLALHLTLRDQIATDRPKGMSQIFQQYCQKFDTSLAAEHEMMECLAVSLWQAMRQGEEFNLENYLESLKSRL